MPQANLALGSYGWSWWLTTSSMKMRQVRRLLDVEAPFDAMNKDGDTQLHFADLWGF